MVADPAVLLAPCEPADWQTIQPHVRGGYRYKCKSYNCTLCYTGGSFGVG
jgi:hypothetical protein